MLTNQISTQGSLQHYFVDHDTRQLALECPRVRPYRFMHDQPKGAKREKHIIRRYFVQLTMQLTLGEPEPPVSRSSHARTTLNCWAEPS